MDIAAFMIFALFSEGIMNICAKLSNPMNLSDIAFSEKVYGKYYILYYFMIFSISE